MNTATDGNLLAGQTSPYLLQHADNPVHWRPWGSEALALARQLDKPVLLSIGYSACHWCHVMAHESFADEQIAAVMNQLFVNIKVDREERPDIDHIYQAALQLLTQQPGGWPLTMFLSPETQMPFFGGTYFPNEARHGMPAFPDLLRRVHGYYRDHQQEIATQADALREAFARLTPSPATAEVAFDSAALETARSELASTFDKEYGGFGNAPKFPQPPRLDRLLRTWRHSAAARSPDVESLYMAVYSLKRMALGGINDQLAGGFFRYSVDAYWMIPHFEKMLHDSAGLLALYAQAWLATGEGLFRQIAQQTAGWVMREMQAPDGGYFSSLDADSEGKEGKYYVWSREQISSVLSDAQYRVGSARFGLERGANFDGHWHLHVFADDAELSGQLEMPAPAIDDLLEQARAALLSERRKRPSPQRDEKVLTSWNALMMRSMAVAALALDDAAMAKSADRALDHIRRTLWHDGKLLASAKDGQAHLDAYLDDYAFLLDALLAMLQVRWRSEDLELAQRLGDALLDRFEDTDDGGFYFTANHHETLIHRPQKMADDALPSGNGIAAVALNRLGALLGEPRYLEAARQTVARAWPMINQFASAHCTLLNALEDILHPVQCVIIRGEPDAMEPWRKTAALHYAPRRQVFAVPSDASDLPPAISVRKPGTTVIAYVCEGSVCSSPLTTIDEFAAGLSEL